jgi:predicted porin
MKKFATLAVLAAITGVTGAAHAQTSSVTLFGVLDASLRQVKNADQSLSSLASGGINTSRLGVRGVEDLGDGLRAGFWLETGLNVDSGTTSDAARFWNRRATVSLAGNFGEVRLGRDFTPTYQAYSDYDPFGDNGVGASSKFDSSLGTARDTGTRADNQVTYLTPGGLGGFYGRVSVAAGEGVAGKKYMGGRLGWGAGPLDVSVSYGQTVVAPVLGEDKFKVMNLGGSYDFGVVKAMAYYAQSEIANQKLATYALGAIMPLGAGQLKAVVTHANASGTNAAGASVDANDANQFALGYVYNLSKRTAVYTTAAYVKNKGNATFAVASAPAMVAGEKSTGYEFGLRHSF